MFAARQHASELATEYYAAAICGIIGIFIIGHWTRVLVNKRRIPEGMVKALSPFAAVTRYVIASCTTKPCYSKRYDF
jgi:hypothetical protein